MGRQKKNVDAIGDDIFAELAAETGGEVVGESEKASNYYIVYW